MSKEDELKLESLGKMFKNLHERRNSNKQLTEIRNKYSFIFIIYFFYNWVTIVLGTMAIFQNTILNSIIAIIAIGVNIYVFSFFIKYYTKEFEKENEIIEQQLQEILDEADSIIERNDVRPSTYYKKYFGFGSGAINEVILDEEYSKKYKGEK